MKNSIAATWMVWETITLSEVSPIEKDKYDISVICEIENNYTNELVYRTEIGIENKLTATKGLKREGGIN